MLSLLLFFGVHSNVHASHVRRLQENQIEYLCGPGSLNLLLSSPLPQQFTFDKKATAGNIVNVLGGALSQQGCEFVYGDKAILPSYTILCDSLSPHTHLVCSSSSSSSPALPHVYDFVEFRPPILPEQQDKFLEYQHNKRIESKKNSLASTTTSTPSPPPPPQKEYPYTSTEIIADNLEGSIGGYLERFLAHHFGPIHPFLTYRNNESGIYSMSTGEQKTSVRNEKVGSSSSSMYKKKKAKDDEEVRISLTADFGAGTKEAAYVSELMINNFNPHFTLHGGDVYYVGEPGEVISNTLGVAPNNTKYGVKFPLGSLGGFAMNGNHEMYSRGYGYYDVLLPQMGIIDTKTGKPTGQKASYSALENAYWRVIDLDTGYHTYSEVKIENSNNTQPEPVIEWLKNEVQISNESDTRGIIFISHHQYFSAFGKSPSTATPAQIAALLPPNRTIIWLWGHEHRLAFYEQNYNQSGLDINVFGRCVGNGGFPSTVSQQPARARESRLKAYDDRLYMIDIGFVKVPVGFNGWVYMTFQADTLTIEYRSLMLDGEGNLSRTDSALLIVEQFGLDPKGNVIQTNFSVVDKNITIVTHT